MPLSFNILTLGCRLNQAESESIKRDLIKEGLRYESPEKADIIIINSCTVTLYAAAKSRKTVKRIHKKNKSAFIVFTGCYVNDINKNKFPEINLYIPNNKKNQASRQIINLLKLRINTDVSNHKPKNIDAYHYRKYIKIQTGCDNKCTYCKVRLVRGPNISRCPDDIFKEIEEIIENNTEEIILTGINIGSYNYKGYYLHSLISDLIKMPSIPLIRLSSIEPDTIRNELKYVFSNDYIQPHLHIPLQSGSNKILKRMGRNYNVEYYKKLIRELKTIKKNLTIGCDIITGFPGEDEKDFKATLEVMEEINLFHIFPYSPMIGTPASIMTQVPSHIIKKRMEIILKKAIKIEENFKKRFIGKSLTSIFIHKNKFLSENYIEISTSMINKKLNSSPLKKAKIMIKQVKNNRAFGCIIK